MINAHRLRACLLLYSRLACCRGQPRRWIRPSIRAAGVEGAEAHRGDNNAVLGGTLVYSSWSALQGKSSVEHPPTPDRQRDLSNRKSPLIHTKGPTARPDKWHHLLPRTVWETLNDPWWRRWNEMLTALSLHPRLRSVYRHWQSDGGGVARVWGECIKVGPNSRSGSCGRLQAFFLSLWLSCRREAPEDMKLWLAWHRKRRAPCVHILPIGTPEIYLKLFSLDWLRLPQHSKNKST